MKLLVNCCRLSRNFNNYHKTPLDRTISATDYAPTGRTYFRITAFLLNCRRRTKDDRRFFATAQWERKHLTEWLTVQSPNHGSSPMCLKRRVGRNTGCPSFSGYSQNRRVALWCGPYRYITRQKQRMLPGVFFEPVVFCLDLTADRERRNHHDQLRCGINHCSGGTRGLDFALRGSTENG